MNIENMLSESWARCRQLARLARQDAHRSAEFDRLDPDATLRLVRQSPASKAGKN